MNTFVSAARRELSAFHSDEKGMNVVEAVLLVAVAGIIMVGVVKWAKPSLLDVVARKIKEIVETVAPV